MCFYYWSIIYNYICHHYSPLSRSLYLFMLVIVLLLLHIVMIQRSLFKWLPRTESRSHCQSLPVGYTRTAFPWFKGPAPKKPDTVSAEAWLMFRFCSCHNSMIFLDKYHKYRLFKWLLEFIFHLVVFPMGFPP